MEKTLTLTLEIGGKTLVIGSGSAYRLVGVSGLEAGEYTLSVTENGGRDGGAPDGVHVKSRNIGITFEAACDDEDEVHRTFLTGFFLPGEMGTLTVKRGEGKPRIIGMTAAEVKFTRQNLYCPLRAEVRLLCPDPFFTDEADTVLTLKTKKPLLTFPFNSYLGAGLTGGYWYRSNFTYVQNDGDLPIGVSAEIRAAGGQVVNPCILCGGKKVTVSDTLNVGDRLLISTVPGKKKIEKNGVKTYCFDRGSIFFQVPRGRHMVIFSASTGFDTMEGTLRFRPLYLGA